MTLSKEQGELFTSRESATTTNAWYRRSFEKTEKDKLGYFTSYDDVFGCEWKGLWTQRRHRRKGQGLAGNGLFYEETQAPTKKKTQDQDPFRFHM